MCEPQRVEHEFCYCIEITDFHISFPIPENSQKV